MHLRADGARFPAPRALILDRTRGGSREGPNANCSPRPAPPDPTRHHAPASQSKAAARPFPHAPHRTLQHRDRAAPGRAREAAPRELRGRLRRLQVIPPGTIAQAGVARRRKSLMTPPASTMRSCRSERSWRTRKRRSRVVLTTPIGRRAARDSCSPSMRSTSPRRDRVMVGRIAEEQRGDAEVDEILAVDASERLGDDGAQPKEGGHQRAVLAA